MVAFKDVKKIDNCIKDVRFNMRNPIFDIGKFVIMLFVVYDHIPHLYPKSFDPGMSYFSNLNIGMSMPFFFIVSGYFSASSISSKVFKRLFSFLWPLFSFGIVIALSRYFVGEISFWKMLVYPVWQLFFGSWFLRTLAIIFLIHALVWRFAPERFRCVVLLLIYGLLFFAPRDSVFFWTAQVMHMFPYFTFGMVVMQKWRCYDNSWLAVPAGILFLLTVVLEGNIRTNGMAFYWVSSDWRTVLNDSHLIFCFFARTIVGISGTIFFLWSLDKLLKLIPRLTFLAKFGTTTLGVYLLHEWPLVMVGKHFEISAMSVSVSLGLALALFFVCHYIVIFINSVSFIRNFFFGNYGCLANSLVKFYKKIFIKEPL